MYSDGRLVIDIGRTELRAVWLVMVAVQTFLDCRVFEFVCVEKEVKTFANLLGINLGLKSVPSFSTVNR